jgi:hypothetical protein
MLDLGGVLICMLGGGSMKARKRDAQIIVVPEPSASLQLGTGILGLAALSGRAVCGS